MSLNIALGGNCYLRCNIASGSSNIFSSTKLSKEDISNTESTDYEKKSGKHVIDSYWHCNCAFIDISWLKSNRYYDDIISTAWIYGASVMPMDQRFEIRSYNLYADTNKMDSRKMSDYIREAESSAFAIGGNFGFIGSLNINKYISLCSHCRLYTLIQFAGFAYRESDVVNKTPPWLDDAFNNKDGAIGITVAFPIEGNIGIQCSTEDLYSATVKIFLGKSYLYLPWQLYTKTIMLEGSAGGSYVLKRGNISSFMFEGWCFGIEVNW